jgi:sulfatase maturation enzyme AslB (radical SAM superfamily)
MPKINLVENKTFCMLPFIHTMLDEHDNLRLCCFSNKVKSFPVDFNFKSDKILNDVRSKMLVGDKVSYCETCYSIEDSGGESFRSINSLEWMEKLGISDTDDLEPELIYYDIRNDNLCNLACRICHPAASSQLEKEYKKLNWVIWPRSPKLKITDIVNYSTVKKMYIAGGEPTIMPSFREFLVKAIENNRTDIEIRMLTNATNLNKDILSLLSNFNHLEVSISIDGFDDVNTYIRWPSDWNSIVNNIEKILKITNSVSIGIDVNIWNICSLYKLIDFLENKFPGVIINLTEGWPTEGINIRPFNFPNKELAVERLNLIKHSITYQTKTLFKNKIDYFITRIQTEPIDYDALKKFFTYNDALDASREVKLKDYIPELEACRELITKQI